MEVLKLCIYNIYVVKTTYLRKVDKHESQNRVFILLRKIK